MVLRGLIAAGVLALVGAVVLMLVPVRADGVSGNAIAPRYSSFGWFSYRPVPQDATIADLRRAGVRVPQDAVADRRSQAAATAVGGVVSLGAGLVLVRRRRASTANT